MECSKSESAPPLCVDCGMPRSFDSLFGKRVSRVAVNAVAVAAVVVVNAEFSLMLCTILAQDVGCNDILYLI